LGLKVHTKIHRDDAEGAAAAIRKYHGTGNILVCWEHSQMTNISVALGVTRYGKGSGWSGLPIEYPHKRFDIIWEVPSPYTEISKVESEQVPGLDPPRNSARLSQTVSVQLFSVVILNIACSVAFELVS
jgi:hypothetical protein